MNNDALIAVILLPACLITFVGASARVVIGLFHRRIVGRRVLLMAGLDTSEIPSPPWIVGANLLLVTLSLLLPALLGAQAVAHGAGSLLALIASAAELAIAGAWTIVLFRSTAPIA